jgi:hypothetical protein
MPNQRWNNSIHIAMITNGSVSQALVSPCLGFITITVTFSATPTLQISQINYFYIIRRDFSVPVMQL